MATIKGPIIIIIEWLSWCGEYYILFIIISIVIIEKIDQRLTIPHCWCKRKTYWIIITKIITSWMITVLKLWTTRKQYIIQLVRILPLKINQIFQWKWECFLLLSIKQRIKIIRQRFTTKPKVVSKPLKSSDESWESTEISRVVNFPIISPVQSKISNEHERNVGTEKPEVTKSPAVS